ncbi:hypothetical protein [Tenacibaculum sp. M341]|uniref:hypothetical protein n=1 Tax=Tenacibaculum sp. M341 TaxID=2530339 RepID=UPI00104A28B0|nr:hypothetical protein [Tenacibaculum sp. M341]TCI93194.1 hypothetical protein EYW44_06145 [Tenacibaculum sp. M341]
MEKHRFNKYLQHYVRNEKKQGRVFSYDYISSMGSIYESHSEMERLNAVHEGVEDFYKNVKDGYGFQWQMDEQRTVSGRIKFTVFEQMIGDWKRIVYFDDEDLQINPDLEFFKPLDVPAAEHRVGFIMRPNEIDPYLYYQDAGETDLHLLDLDFKGYTEMALEAKVFRYWQVVLLHYDGRKLGGPETDNFKKFMPQIFPDFSWDKFIEKYESVRLSKK